jgi:hypothetical protein
MKLILDTDIDGFEKVDIVGSDLFSALASAFFSVDSILLLLKRGGDVRLKKDVPFDVDTDAPFFGKRVQALRRSLLAR